MSTLYLDLETYSERDIRACGTYAYAEAAEILLFAWALGDGPVHCWDATDARTGAEGLWSLTEALHGADTLVAHNAMFDRTILARPAPGSGVDFRAFTDPGQWRCTMVRGMALGFPGSLAQLGAALHLPADKAKDADGRKLVGRFCRPAPSNHKADRYTRETHPGEWSRFVEYARQDVAAMREIDRLLPTWNDDWPLWHLDQRVNDRGFAVDRGLVEAGAAEAVAEAARYRARLADLTGGMVTAPTQRARLLDYLHSTCGLALPDTRAGTVRGALDGAGLTARTREILEIALAANKTSTAKYKALSPAISRDGRFRGGLQYSGAQRTRRWSGRTYQPQNLPSRLPDAVLDDTEDFIRALKAGVADLAFGDTLLRASAALRGVVVAPPGRRLAVADLSNIEGRLNAWLAGEDWKLAAFAAFDRGEGPDLYKVAAGRILGKPPAAIDKTERNGIGKVAELALGYAGGVGAIQNFAAGRMAALMPVVRAAAPEAVAQAAENWATWGAARNAERDAPFGEDEWLASEAVKVAWRARHPAIEGLWRACEDAARGAVEAPGATFRAGPHLRFRRAGYMGRDYLVCALPSGRFLIYFEPRAADDGTLSAMRVDPITKRWVRATFYGGLIVENACQSVARDVMAASMARAEDAGFDLVLTVHDELVAETTSGTGEELAAIMAANPPWADGLPLAAEGETMTRYRK